MENDYYITIDDYDMYLPKKIKYRLQDGIAEEIFIKFLKEKLEFYCNHYNHLDIMSLIPKFNDDISEDEHISEIIKSILCLLDDYTGLKNTKSLTKKLLKKYKTKNK